MIIFAIKKVIMMRLLIVNHPLPRDPLVGWPESIKPKSIIPVGETCTKSHLEQKVCRNPLHSVSLTLSKSAPVHSPLFGQNRILYGHVCALAAATSRQMAAFVSI